MTDPYDQIYDLKKMEAEHALALRQEVVHDALKELTIEQAAEAVLAHFSARPDLAEDYDDLMRLANKLGRLAWQNI